MNEIDGRLRDHFLLIEERYANEIDELLDQADKVQYLFHIDVWQKQSSDSDRNNFLWPVQQICFGRQQYKY